MKKLIFATVAVGALFSYGPAQAGLGSAQASLDVRLNVATSCSLVGGNALIDFGTVAAGTLGQNLDGDTTKNGGVPITINCTTASPAPTMTYNQGTSDTPTARFMADTNNNKIPFTLASDAAFTKVRAPGSAQALPGFAVGSNKIDLFVRIPSGTVLPVGTFADTITMDMTF